jgi:methionyl-tRNA formyltransferase
MNIVFMGTPNYAKVILEELIKNFDVKLVLTQPDKPVGRKKILTPPPVKETALEHNIKVLQPTTLKDSQVVNEIKNSKPNFIVVAAYGMLLPKEILEIAPCINLHASILPEYRGASPIQSAILNGDEFSGVTAMLMDEGLDTGDMLSFSFVKSSLYPTLPQMTKQLSKMAAKLIIDTLNEYENINPIKQLGALSSKCKKITKSDGLVDFKDALNLIKKYNAYFGWPGVFLKSGLKLIEIALVDSDKEFKEGEIIEINKDFIVVGCKKGAIKIFTLQPPSKPKMKAYDYVNGKRIKVGDTLS